MLYYHSSTTSFLTSRLQFKNESHVIWILYGSNGESIFIPSDVLIFIALCFETRASNRTIVIGAAATNQHADFVLLMADLRV